MRRRRRLVRAVAERPRRSRPATRSRSSSRSSPRRSSDSGIGRKEIGFTCSGSATTSPARRSRSSSGLDAVGAWPPIRESHVEMDGAWALYEAWVRLQHGDVDTALVYAFGKSSPGDLPTCSACSSTRTTWRRCGPTRSSIAALQARAWLDAGHDEREMAEVAARSRPRRRRTTRTRRSRATPTSTSCSPSRTSWRRCASTTARRSPTAPPRSCSPPATGHARCRERPAWIRGIDHRIEAHGLGVRDLDHVAVDAAAGERRGRERRRRRRAARAVHPPGADPARRARARATASTSTRRAARSRPTR